MRDQQMVRTTFRVPSGLRTTSCQHRTGDCLGSTTVSSRPSRANSRLGMGTLVKVNGTGVPTDPDDRFAGDFATGRH